MKKISDKTILIITLLIYFFTANYHLLLTANVRGASTYLMLMSLALIRPITSFLNSRNIYYKDFIKEQDKVFLLLWFLFSLFIMASEIYNNDLEEGIFFLLVVPTVFFFGFNLIFTEKESHLINIISSLPFILMALGMVVKKHTFNTNTIALITVFAGVSLIILEENVVRSKNFIHFLDYEFIIGTLFLVILRINSRTALLGLALVYGLNGIFNIIEVLSSKNKHRHYYIIYYFLLLILVLLAGNLILDKLNTILYKWGEDFSSNRFTIWDITMEKAKLLGNGYDFFLDTPDPDPLLVGVSLKGPHNILFGIIGYTGLLPAVIFIILVIKLVKDIVIKSVLNRNLLKYRSIILFTSSYLFIGLLEGFLQFPFYRTANIIWLILIARFYLGNNDQVKKEVKSLNRQSLINLQIFWLIVIAILALLSALYVPGDGNLFGLFKVIKRYIK